MAWHEVQLADRKVAVTVAGAVRFESVQTFVADAQPVHPTSSWPVAAVAVSWMLPPGVTAAVQSPGQLIGSTTAPPSGAVIVPLPDTAADTTTFAAPNVAETLFAAVIGPIVHVDSVDVVHPAQLVTFDPAAGNAVRTIEAPFATVPVHAVQAVLPVWHAMGGVVGASRRPPYGGVKVGVIAGYVFAVRAKLAGLKLAVTVFAPVIEMVQREAKPVPDTEVQQIGRAHV